MVATSSKLAMAPREGQVAGQEDTPGPAKTVGSGDGACSFWSRLGSLPIVQSTKDLYVSSKEKNELLGRGLGLIEYGVTVASDPVLKVVDRVPGASKLDNLACNCLDKIETKVPAIHEQPRELLQHVKGGARNAIQSSVRKVLRTSPGRQVIRRLDQMITWSEEKLDAVQGKPEAEEPETDEGEQQTKATEPGLVVRVGVIPTLDIYLKFLKMMKQLLAGIAGLSTRLGSPRKALDSAPRRKVSPRKRLPKEGVVQRLTAAAMKMLRLGKNGSDPTFDAAAATSSPRTTSEMTTKRKLEEVDESESEEETMNLEEALQNYKSDDDPDYMPPVEQPSVDSLEFEEGDTESDIETETLAASDKKGRQCQQIKDSGPPKPSGAKDTQPSPSSKPPSSETPASNASSVDVQSA